MMPKMLRGSSPPYFKEMEHGTLVIKMATIRWCPIFPKWDIYQPLGFQATHQIAKQYDNDDNLLMSLYKEHEKHINMVISPRIIWIHMVKFHEDEWHGENSPTKGSATKNGDLRCCACWVNVPRGIDLRVVHPKNCSLLVLIRPQSCSLLIICDCSSLVIQYLNVHPSTLAKCNIYIYRYIYI